MTSLLVVGAGRVGRALARLADRHGVDHTLISRTDGWEALDGPTGTPVIVATRNDDLPGVVSRVPADRHGDLVFVQNGMLRPWLREAGLADATRGLLFFAVADRTSDPVPGDDPSPFTGPHAEAVATLFTGLGLPARAVEAEAFKAVELEKLLWNCTFGLMGQAHGLAVGPLCDAHPEQLALLVDELLATGEQALDLSLDRDPLLARLVAYSRSIADYQGAMKEWRWRNGWFVDQARSQGRATPIHHHLLAAAWPPADGSGPDEAPTAG